MSAQTGSPSTPPLAAGSGLPARARWSFSRLRSDPNPVWMRELRQSARLQRTPVILMTITVAIALLICSVGGVASSTAEPARVGVGIFHTFFSLAFALVTWLGPAVAASTIAGERNGRTWEALALTGLSPARIARGKFLAAFTYVGLYLVMLAPVGALPFLFGGVTATEVILAFVCCFVFAQLAVAFGLAISSKFQSSAAAIIVTLLVTLITSFNVYGIGWGLSYPAHEQWTAVPDSVPVWLPTAWVRADFGLPYVAFLLVLPAVAVWVPAWLFYEITVANLASPSDDRSTRLRLWTIASSLAITGSFALIAFATRKVEWVMAQGSLLFTFFIFAIFLVAGEPLGPSRRVRVAWQREGRGPLLRAFGPGVLGASTWVLGLIVVTFVATVAVGVLVVSPGVEHSMVIAVSAHLAAFLVFLCGFSAFFRSRAQGATVPRVLLLVAILAAAIGPWILMAVAGLLSRSGDGALPLAAPSPSYAFVLAEQIRLAPKNLSDFLLPSIFCSTGYVLFGLGLLAMAGARTRRRLEEEQARLSALESLLEAELRAAMAVHESAAEGSLPVQAAP